MLMRADQSPVRKTSEMSLKPRRQILVWLALAALLAVCPASGAIQDEYILRCSPTTVSGVLPVTRELRVRHLSRSQPSRCCTRAVHERGQRGPGLRPPATLANGRGRCRNRIGGGESGKHDAKREALGRTSRRGQRPGGSLGSAAFVKKEKARKTRALAKRARMHA